MYSSRRESRICRRIEASLQNVYDDHKHDRKNNHSIYPDFEETLYEVVGLTKASNSRRLLCMVELCTVLNIEPSDELKTLTQEEQLQLLNEQLCDRLRPSFVDQFVQNVPLEMLKMFMRVLSHVLIATLNDAWWAWKEDSNKWDSYPLNQFPAELKTQMKEFAATFQGWKEKSAFFFRLVRHMENNIMNKFFFHLIVDDCITGNITLGVETASRKLYERVNPKHARILTKYTIAKILTPYARRWRPHRPHAKQHAL